MQVVVRPRDTSGEVEKAVLHLWLWHGGLVELGSKSQHVVEWEEHGLSEPAGRDQG